MTIGDAAALDAAKLEQFVFRAVDEVGATLNAALVVMGDRLGLYRALAGAGALTPAELAERTGTAERYVREWLNAQAAGGYVTTTRTSGRYTLPPEQAVALTDEDSPAYLPGFFQIALGSVIDSPAHHRGGPQRRRRRLARAQPRRPRGLRAVLPPGLQRQPRRRRGCPRSTASSSKLERGRPRRRRRLRPRRLDDPDGAGVPALDVRRLRLPRRLDRDRAPSAPRRPAWPTASRSRSRPPRSTPATDYDLVTMFDCLHDMGDPVGAARHVLAHARARRHVDDRRAGGRRPRRGQPQPGRPRLLRVLDAAVHAGLAVAGRRAGARRAGRRRRGSARSSRAAGFTRFRRAAETPFNLVFEARP